MSFISLVGEQMGATLDPARYRQQEEKRSRAVAKARDMLMIEVGRKFALLDRLVLVA